MNKSKYLSILNEIKEQGGSELGDNPNENVLIIDGLNTFIRVCLLYTSPSPRDQRGSRMPSSA